MEDLLKKLENYLTLGLLFVIPVIVLPFFPNAFVTGKLLALSFGVVLLLGLKALRTIIEGKLEFQIGKFDGPVIFLAVVYVISTILRSPNKMEALLLPGNATIFIAGAFLYLLVNQLDKKYKNLVGLTLVLSATLYTVLAGLAAFGVFGYLKFLPVYIQSVNFTPGAGYLTSAIFLSATLPFFVKYFLQNRNPVMKSFFAVTGVLTALFISYSVFNMLPGRPFTPQTPGFDTSWSIAIDTLKVSPLIGVGPGNYLSAFNQFRPVSFNNKGVWDIKFGNANDMYLTTATETGLLGFFSLAMILLTVYRMFKKEFKEKNLFIPNFYKENPELLSLLILIVVFVFFPSTIVTATLLFVLLALASTTRQTQLNLKSQTPLSSTDSENTGTTQMASQTIYSRLPAILVAGPVLILAGLFFYKSYYLVLGEYKFQQALNALAKNDGVSTYNFMREAINTNPLVDRYHATYSQVNLALANAIAQKGADNITDDDRNQITQLVQQAIREGQSTVALNPGRAGNWSILAQIYQVIIPLAQGADVFAAQSYNQAVALDPTYPQFRIALGGLYYAAGNYEQAIRILELAVSTKPNLANAHYNLAFAYRENKNYDAAVQAMTNVLSIVDKNSKDYQVAKTELENIQKLQGEAKAKAVSGASGEELTAPEGAKQPLLEPPLELPQESEPPQAPVSPTPQPQAEGISPTPTIIP